MTLAFLRDAITKVLQDRVDALAQSAIDMRVHPEMRSDTYALVQADKLAQARAFAEAAKIVVQEYKKLTEAPAADAPKDVEQPKVKEKPYG